MDELALAELKALWHATNMAKDWLWGLGLDSSDERVRSLNRLGGKMAHLIGQAHGLEELGRLSFEPNWKEVAR